MANLFDKFKDIMNLNDFEDDEDMEYEGDEFNSFTGEPQPVAQAEPGRLKALSGGKSKVMNLQASIQMEVVVMNPTSYDEAQEICDHIRAKKPCIINLENVPFEIAQRIMDFVSGSCYTLDGNMQRVTNNIFLIAPENVDILGDFQEELKSNGLFKWEK